MKKLCPLFIYYLSIVNLSSQNNVQPPYFSELFDLFFSKAIHLNLETGASSNIYSTYDSTLFIVNNRAFAKKEPLEGAKVAKLNVLNGNEEIYFIAPAPEYIEKGGKLNHIWIWALAATDSLLFIAVDEEIWIYCFTNRQYEYLKTIPVKSVTILAFVNNYLHAFIEIDNGFDWVKIDMKNFEMENVRKLVLKNPFFLQIAPFQKISIANNALYLLQQNIPSIEKYSLGGEFLFNYSFDIPNWNNIPQNITQKLDSMGNDAERIAAFQQYSLFDYNFIQQFYVFSCERLLLIAVDRNQTEETFITPYYVQNIGDTTIVDAYTIKLPDNERFRAKYFPFYLTRAEGNLIFTQIKEYIAQIYRGTTVSWNNKTQKEYRKECDLYHRDNEPIEKIETYYFKKNYIPIDSIQFLDYDDQPFSLNDINKDKAIFIVSQQPQCATCIKILWSYFSQLKSADTELYTIAENRLSYLAKKESIKEIGIYLKTDYIPLFINTKHLNTATRRLLTQKSNPLVILFNKKLQHIEVISSGHIIENIMGNLKPTFLNTIHNFIAN